MDRLRIWHRMVGVAAVGFILGTATDPPHATVRLLVLSLSAALGIAGARYSRRSVWSGIWPIFLFGPVGLLITWSYPRRGSVTGRNTFDESTTSARVRTVHGPAYLGDWSTG